MGGHRQPAGRVGRETLTLHGRGPTGLVNGKGGMHTAAGMVIPAHSGFGRHPAHAWHKRCATSIPSLGVPLTVFSGSLKP